MPTTESNRIEYKRELTDKFERSVVAFLNYAGGGEILLGVDDDGTVVGIEDPDGAQLKIVDRIKNNIRPTILGLFDVIHEKREGKSIIHVVISGGTQRPYYLRARGMTEDGCFIRVGSSSQPMTEKMIENCIATRRKITLATTISPNQNLTFTQLGIYYQEHDLELTSQFLDNLDMRLPSGEYNFVAYLLADRNGASIKVVKYAGKDKIDLIENEELGYRCLITATQRVLEKLTVENRTFAKITYPKRIERSMIDKAALREAVINAIVHNDYLMTVPLVEIFSDRITITSAGGLIDGLSVENFFKGRSMPRNRELMRVFKDVELVEHIGSGMNRIMRAYDRSVFEITDGFLSITFPFAEGLAESDAKVTDRVTDKNADITDDKGDRVKRKDGIAATKVTDRASVGVTDKVSDKNGDIAGSKGDRINVKSGRVTAKVTDRVAAGVTDKVTDNDALLLGFLRKNPGATLPQLAKKLSVSRKTVAQKIRCLREAGIITRQGSDRSGTWRIN